MVPLGRCRGIIRYFCIPRQVAQVSSVETGESVKHSAETALNTKVYEIV